MKTYQCDRCKKELELYSDLKPIQLGKDVYELCQDCYLGVDKLERIAQNKLNKDLTKYLSSGNKE